MKRMSAGRSACVMGALKAKSLRKELSWVGGHSKGARGAGAEEQEEQPEMPSDLAVTHSVENR